MGMSDFWNMESDAQQRPHEADPIDEAIAAISTSNLTILRLCEEKLGTYMEIAYEWSWDEVMSMVEVLDIREEKRKRHAALQRAEDLATR